MKHDCAQRNVQIRATELAVSERGNYKDEAVIGKGQPRAVYEHFYGK